MWSWIGRTTKRFVIESRFLDESGTDLKCQLREVLFQFLFSVSISIFIYEYMQLYKEFKLKEKTEIERELHAAKCQLREVPEKKKHLFLVTKLHVKKFYMLFR
jgi:hypothetical protein